MPRTPLIAAALLACACCACSQPKPPPVDDPPTPKAVEDTELRDAIKAPIDRAKSVEQTVQDAADKQRADIEANGG
ncbi:MAG: hypothetical protein ABJA62_00970 [Luteimonas sp.]